MSPRARRGLYAILLLGAMLRVAAALAPNIYWADETFQVLEQGHRALFGYGMVPWEYVVGYRNWLGAGVVAGMLLPFKLLGLGPNVYGPAISIAFALSSLAIVWSAFVAGARLHSTRAGVAAAALAAIWYELVYFGPKPGYEIVATTLLFSGFGLALSEQPGRPRLLLSGFLFGLSLAWRPMYGLAAVPLFLIVCLIYRQQWKALLWISGAGLCAILFAGLVDAWTWGDLFHSYLRMSTVVEDYRSGGQGPVSGSSTELMLNTFLMQNRLLYLLPLLLVGACIPSRRERANVEPSAAPGLNRLQFRWAIYLLLLVALVLMFWFHVRMPHQEYRWYFVMIPILLLLLAITLTELLSRIDWLRLQTALWIICALGVLAVTVCGALQFDDYQRLSTGRIPARTLAGSSQSHRTIWFQRSDDIRAYRLLSQKRDLCGLFDAAAPWYLTPGYFNLHQPVLIRNLAAAEIPTNGLQLLHKVLPLWMASHSNYLLAPQFSPDPLESAVVSGEIERIAQSGELAIYRKVSTQPCMPALPVSDVYRDVPNWVLSKSGIKPRR